jgi:hypothetical protein
VSVRTVIKATLVVTAGILICGAIFLVFAYLGERIETSRVEAAIKRDCSVELKVDPNEILEPGIVFKNYSISGTPMKLTCQGANWSCDCTEDNQSTRSATR